MRRLTGLAAAFVFLAVVAVVVVIAVRLGMLLAPRIDRMTQPDNEDEGGDRD